MYLQTILIPKNNFTLEEAKKWIKDHKYRLSFGGKSVHITSHFYRFRQASFKKNANYHTLTIRNGIRFVFIR